jgi:hypothetical protein
MNAERLKLAVLAGDVLLIELTKLLDTAPDIKRQKRFKPLLQASDAFAAVRFDDMTKGGLDSPAIRAYIKGEMPPRQRTDEKAPATERSVHS